MLKNDMLCYTGFFFLLRPVDEVVGHSWHDTYALWLFEETKSCNDDITGDFCVHPIRRAFWTSFSVDHV